MKKYRYAAGAIAVLLLGWLFYEHGHIPDKEEIIRGGKALSPAGLIAFSMVLPLFGFPISILLVLIGLRFGFGWGMAVTAGCIAFHHGAAYVICGTRWSGPLRKFMADRGWHLPDFGKGKAIWMTALFASVHGPPYTLKLYLLGLARPAFPIYLFVGGGCYTLFSIIPVGAAAAAVHMDPTWIYVGVGVLSAGFLLKACIDRRRESQGRSSPR